MLCPLILLRLLAPTYNNPLCSRCCRPWRSTSTRRREAHGSGSNEDSRSATRGPQPLDTIARLSPFRNPRNRGPRRCCCSRRLRAAGCWRRHPLAGVCCSRTRLPSASRNGPPRPPAHSAAQKSRLPQIFTKISFRCVTTYKLVQSIVSIDLFIGGWIDGGLEVKCINSSRDWNDNYTTNWIGEFRERERERVSYYPSQSSSSSSISTIASRNGTFSTARNPLLSVS